MRKELLLLAPLLLLVLMFYVVWEPAPEPTSSKQNPYSGVLVLEEDGHSERRIAEGDRQPLRERLDGVEIPESLTLEQYREALRQLESREASSLGLMAFLQETNEVFRVGWNRGEALEQLQKEQLQKLDVEGAKYRLAVAKLEDGQFMTTTEAPRSASGWIPDSTLRPSFTLGVGGSFITFESPPEDDPELIAVMDRRREAQESARQLQCEEFNRLPFAERKKRIESHVQASTIISEPLLAANRVYMSVESRKALRDRVLPHFMEIDRNNYTVRRQR